MRSLMLPLRPFMLCVLFALYAAPIIAQTPHGDTHGDATAAPTATAAAVATPPAMENTWRHMVPRDTMLARVRMHVMALAHDSMGGRRPPGRGNTLAAAYVGRAFERAGLLPLGTEGSRRRAKKGPERFYETFSYLHGVDVGKGNAAVIKRAGGQPEIILAPGADFTPLGFSSNATATGPLVFVGYGLRDSASGYDDYAGVDARGAILVMMRYSPEGDVPHGRFSNAASWTSKVRAAVDHGAKGIIFINQPGELSELPPVSFIRGFLDAGIPCLFATDGSLAALRDPSGRTLTELRSIIDSTLQPASFALDGAKATITASVKRLESPIPNIVGLLPGTDPTLRDETIVIGAHFDHLGDGGEGSLAGGSAPAIHYGADDNASGTAGMLALAEELAGRRDNRRTIMFIAFNAEEVGLLGSQNFLRGAELPKGMRIVAMINLDMIGRLDSLKLQVQGTGTSPVFEPLLDSLNPGLALKYSKEGFGPSDHASFYTKGIPVLAFFTGVHRDYHRPSDTWEKINYDGEVRIVDFVAQVTRALDQLPTAPTFTKADPPVAARRSSGFNVYVGTMPDYGYEGRGLRITGTSGGSPAEKAGLVEGDIIVRMGDYPIANIYDYMDALGHFKAAQPVLTTIMRAGNEMTVTIVMGAR